MIFHCVDCRQDKPIQAEGGAGYATFINGDKVCYACVAVRDRAAMIEHGRSSALPLYLTRKSIHKPNNGTWAVTNWPNTLSFPVERISQGGHNIAGTRYDVWFYGPDGYIWHGVQYGDNTQIVHCKRSSERVQRT